jgi:hypothetical protein
MRSPTSSTPGWSAPSASPTSAGGVTTGGTGSSGDARGDGPDGSGAGGDGAAAESGRGRRVGRPLVVAGVLLVAAALAAIAAVASGDTDESATSTTDTDVLAATDAATSTTTEGPVDPDHAVQPDVTYDVPGVPDTTPALDAALADLDAIVAPLGTVTSAHPNALFHIRTTPATLRYHTYHPKGARGCVGFLSRPLTVTGQWSKLVQLGPDVLTVLTVVDLEDEEQAREAFVALSLGQGPEAENCRGFDETWGVADYDELDIVQQDGALGLDEPLHVATFVSQGAPPDFPMYTYSLTGAVQRDASVIAFAVLTSPARGPIEPTTMGQVVQNLLDRLPD